MLEFFQIRYGHENFSNCRSYMKNARIEAKQLKLTYSKTGAAANNLISASSGENFICFNTQLAKLDRVVNNSVNKYSSQAAVDTFFAAIVHFLNFAKSLSRASKKYFCK